MKKKRLNKKNIMQDIGLNLLSVLIFFIMMFFNLWFLIWVTFSPLWLVFKRNNLVGCITHALIFVFLLNISSFYWFTHYGLNLLFISMGLMSFFGLFYVIFIKYFSRNLFLEILSFPLGWILLVIILEINPLSSAWVNFAFFWPMMAPLIWIIHGWGVTFLIILSNSLIAEYLFRKDRRILLIIFALFVVILSCFIFSSYLNYSGKEIKVALIQGNVNESWNWRINNTNSIFQRYESLSLNASTQGVNLIIWPEYSLPRDIFEDQEYYLKIQNLSKKTNSYILIGSVIFLDKNERILIKDKKDIAILFSPKGEILNWYETPFPMPLDKTVKKGEFPHNKNVINSSFGNFTVGLCFEEILLQRFKEKSDFIVLLSNNQIFDNSFGKELVSLFPRLIAAENKRYVLRNTNTGITEIINPSGKVIGRLNPDKSGILIGNIYI